MDEPVITSVCYWCSDQRRFPLYQICIGESLKKDHNLACEDCREAIWTERECNSVSEKCTKTETCIRCAEDYHPCRGVFVINDNYKKIRENPDETKDFVIKVCAVCARHPGVTKKWWCMPDYISDHGRARCVTCKESDLTRGKLWGRCSKCQAT